MPVAMTLKNIPDNVYQKLKVSAQTNRRSLNSEAIVALEAMLLPVQISVIDRLIRARELRRTLPVGGIGEFDGAMIDKLKREGRQ